MEIPWGRILELDMGAQKWGRVLYLVIKPTLICSVCGFKINNWRKDSEGYIVCPYCEQVTDENYEICKCGEHDQMRLRVVQNNNFGLDADGMVELNDKVGKGISVCKKELEKEIEEHKIRLLNAKESVDKKRLIEWTSSDDYDPVKPMPDWIIEKWKYENQK